MDTFILSIPRLKYIIRDETRFKPSFHPLNTLALFARKRFIDEHGRYRRFIYNPQAIYRQKGIIYPNLTIIESLNHPRYSCNLYVSFSIPKILWGHSYSDPTNNEKDKVINLLVTRLQEMRVIVEKEVITNSILQTLHFSKNFLFPNLEEAKIFLERLSKVSLGKWFENNTKTYSFDGKAVRFHTNVFEIIFYLKYADVLQKGNRSVDRRKTLQEIEIAKQYKKDGKIPPVVRMEVRFSGTRSISSHLEASTGIKRSYWTFNDAFNTELSNKVLSYYWRKIIADPLNHFLLSKSSYKDVCLRVQAVTEGERSKNVDEMLGLYFRIKELGVKGLKEDMLLRHSRPTYKRKMDELASFIEQFVQQEDSLIKIVTDALEGKTTPKFEDEDVQLKLI